MDITEATANTNIGGSQGGSGGLTGFLRMRKLKMKLWKLKTNKG